MGSTPEVQDGSRREVDDGTRHEKSPSFLRGFFEAGDGIRTRDPDLGKVVLYQLSYSREGGGL